MNVENEYLPCDEQDIDVIPSEAFLDMVEYVNDCIKGGVISEETGRDLIENEDWDEIKRMMDFEYENK